MNCICRLCLSVTPELVQDIFDNGELMQKISSCLQTDILKEESLPNQICLTCNEKLDQYLMYIKTVMNNQKTLYHHLKLGNDCLESFYLILKDGTKIKDEIVETIEISDANTTDKHESEDTVKNEYDEVDIEDNYSSSEDNIPLLSLKYEKQSQVTQENTKRIKRNGRKNKSSKVNTSCKISKENIEQSISSTLPEFKCLMCFVVFDTRNLLTKHYKIAHKPAKPVKSEKISCLKVGKDKYKCGRCETIFLRKNAVYRHIHSKHHPKSRPYICNLCGKTFKMISEIILHLRAHSEFKLFCSLGCGFNTAYVHALNIHEKKHRNEYEYKYKCKECGKGFDIKSWFEEHQNVHTGANPFVCKECGRAYHCRRYLVRHETCAHRQPAAVTDHTRYVCTRCGVPCHTKIALVDHMATEHGVKHSNKRFLCDTCGKSLRNSFYLKEHKNVHLGVRSHICSTCSKPFLTARNLRKHSRTHGDLALHKPHQCGRCGNRYVHRAALLKHESRWLEDELIFI